ncbi:MAG: hypothetical protein HYZ81_26335 [Nitrospinae bacterium]|nr:hypothetical protein [Nitrospinota bacterium]
MATEMSEQTTAGKRWVEDTLRRLAGELNIPVEELRWRDDFPGPYLSSLSFNVRGGRGMIEVRLREIQDCPNPSNQTVRASLEEQVRNCLRDVSARLR